MGKSGIIGKKIAATLASTGTPSFFLHPGEASPGCKKKLGVPVLAKVAAIFFPMIPDFPIPETINFPEL